MIKQDTLEKQAKIIYLGIGSNLGNRINNIEKAKSKLLESGIFILDVSSYYQSLSWPNSNNPKFYNIVLKITSKLNEIELLLLCKKIEKALGRKKAPKNSPRKCDIDIIDFNKKIKKHSINLPHPRMHRRNFVLLPLFEIDKNWKHPISKLHIKALILSLSNRDISSIKKI